MKYDRRKQIILMSMLVVAVLLITVGFAAFSSILKIESTVTYTVDSDVFKIKFSKISNSIVDGPNNPVSPISGNGNSATINNEGIPKISKLHANFTAPGQTVIYEFYVVNQTPYDAYLTLINYLNVYGTFETKTCTGSNGATESLVNKACEGISVMVEVDSTIATQTTQVENHKLNKGASEKVRVTISYTGQAIDGSMEVTFGDISLVYLTADEISKEQSDESELLYTGTIYRNSTENLYLGNYINANNRWCIVEPGGINSCIYNDYLDVVFNSREECEEFLETMPTATCEQMPVSFKINPPSISQKYYVKHDIVDNRVTASYACITYIENDKRKDACLKGGDESYYESNQATLHSLESYFNTLTSDSGSGHCTFYNSHSGCYSDFLTLHTNSYGFVHSDAGREFCYVDSNGYSFCTE